MTLNVVDSLHQALARVEVAARGGRSDLAREEVAVRTRSRPWARLRCLPTQYVTLCQYTVVLMNVFIMYLSFYLCISCHSVCVCVCMCISMSVYVSTIEYMHKHTRTRTHTHTHTHTKIHMCAHINTHAHKHTRTHNTSTYYVTHTRTKIHMCAHINTLAHTRKHTRTHIRIHTKTYMCAHGSSGSRSRRQRLAWGMVNKAKLSHPAVRGYR